MSAVIVVADDLRQRVAEILREQARSHPTASAAARIRPEAFDIVTEEVARRVDPAFDLETSVTANIGRVLAECPELFARRRASIADHLVKHWKTK
jgi:hypothetical protein